MLPRLKNFLSSFDALGLADGEYMITGSGTLAVLGIRDCVDLDVLVLDSVGERLKEQYPDHFKAESFCDKLLFNDLDIMWNFREENRPWTTEEQIRDAMQIEGRRYQDLEKIKFFKKQMMREKDVNDLALIKEYENKL